MTRPHRPSGTRALMRPLPLGIRAVYRNRWLITLRKILHQREFSFLAAARLMKCVFSRILAGTSPQLIFRQRRWRARNNYSANWEATCGRRIFLVTPWVRSALAQFMNGLFCARYRGCCGLHGPHASHYSSHPVAAWQDFSFSIPTKKVRRSE